MRPGRLFSSLFSSTDEEMMRRVQSHDDPGAFARLVARWEGPIFRLCTRMTGDEHAGEDLKQEAFARVFARRREFRPEARFSTWLWRIALNLCHDERRRVRRRGECSFGEPSSCEDLAGGTAAAIEPASSVLAPDVLIESREEGDLVREGLLRLPETSRAVLVLRFCEELKLREIAAILELAPAAAEAKEEVTQTGSEWEKARRALYGSGGDGASGWQQWPAFSEARYDSSLVTALKKQVLEALRNAARLRHVKPSEWIVVTITGSPNATAKRGGSFGYGGRRGDAGGGGFGRGLFGEGDAAQEDSRDAGRPTVMTIRIKKSAADSLAAKEIAEEKFEREAEVNTYLGSGSSGHGPNYRNFLRPYFEKVQGQ